MDWNGHNEIHRRKVRGENIEDIARHSVGEASLSMILQRFNHLGGCLLIRMESPDLINVSDWLDEVKLFADQFLLALVADNRGSDRSA
jgi:hypothetical protein